MQRRCIAADALWKGRRRLGKGQDSGDRTELPTPKKLRDARRKGDVAKSKELGAAVVTLAWLILLATTLGSLAEQLATLAEASLSAALAGEFANAAVTIGWRTGALLVGATALLLVPVAVMGLVAESLQIGPILTGEKLKPSLDKLNPIEGLKRMFGLDGLVELLKSLAKVLILVVLTWLALRGLMPELGRMVAQVEWAGDPGGAQSAARQNLALLEAVTLRLLGWTVAAFVGVALLDRLHAKHSFTKKMKMSRRDVKQEHKNDEGDPHVKSHRRELHREWANSNAAGATRGAAALLVNPTHIAIALEYHPETCPVPVVAGKGEGPLAALMREAAREARVPIVRNVAAARALWTEGEVGGLVPEPLFDAVAEVILWATRARAGEAPLEQDLDRRRYEPVGKA
ncbi:flagellar biosynthesis protein FlhB [Sphingomonas sp. DT-51]|uniref:EscU/YscU/HrcU family type III secretion system export apparatus switch protein n=1 Tax=Sphingomonas sp. DT-51 TaxID=3396165 RepID=UPI003F1B6973